MRIEIDKMNRVLDHIENNLSSWNQMHWVGHNECGTTYCFAGWTVVLEGIRICDRDCGGWEQSLVIAHVHHSELSPEMQVRVDSKFAVVDPTTGDRLHSVSQVARAVLGNPPGILGMFCGDNTLADLRRIVHDYEELAANTHAGGH